MISRPLAHLAALVLIILSAACGNSTSTTAPDPDAHLFGTYSLVSADGKPMPGTLFSPDGMMLRFDSGTSIRLIDNRNFAATFNAAYGDGTGWLPISQSVTGTYREIGTVGPGPIRVRFDVLPLGASDYDAVIDVTKREIILTTEATHPQVMVFRKQVGRGPTAHVLTFDTRWREAWTQIATANAPPGADLTKNTAHIASVRNVENGKPPEPMAYAGNNAIHVVLGTSKLSSDPEEKDVYAAV